MLFKATFTKRFGRRVIKRVVTAPNMEIFNRKRDELIEQGFQIASFTQVPWRLS